MASPFAVFRRNQKIMLAVVGVTLMVAFVLLQPLMDYVGQRQAPQNAVVVETKYGDYDEAELKALQEGRELVEMFLTRTAAATVEAQIAKGQFDPRSRDAMVENLFRQSRAQLMSRSKPGPEAEAIETLVLAKRAEELGMVVSDRAINDLLAELTFDSLTSETLQGIVNNLQMGRRISTARLFAALRTEMLATNLRDLFAASLADIPPAQKFDYYLRLNRRAKAEVMPLAVVDFTSQVENPKDDVLRPFFDKYKDQLADAASPDPGFKEPRRAAFQYFKADFARFTDEMKPQVTDEEIRNYYDANKSQFIAIDLPEESEEKPDEGASEGDPKGEEAKDGEDEKAPAEDKPPAEDAPQDEPKSDEPTEEKPTEEKPAEDDAGGEDKSPEPGQSSAAPRATLRLVSTAAPSDEEPSSEEPQGPAIGAAEKDEATSEPAAPADEKAKPADEPAETPAGDAPETPADDNADKPADEPADGAAAVDESAEVTPPATRYEPLEKVQDQIRDSLASEKAAEKISEIFDLLQAEMRNYADKRALYETRKDSDASVKPPGSFPFAELAKKHGVEAKELPLVSAVEAASEDIGGVYRLVQDPQFGFRTEPFADFAFSTGLPTYRPSVVGDNEGNSYLFWKTDEKESFVPTFEQAHDKVLAAWKMIEARPLAHKRAEELAGQARTAGKSLKEVFEGDAGLKVIETDSFSWMTGGAVPTNPMGGGPVRISQIDGVERIGPDFMETIFALPAGGIGVAANRPKDTVYVARVAEYDQSIDTLRDDFARERRPLYMAVARPERAEMYEAWIKNLEREADVRWLRPADFARRRSDDASRM